MVIIIGITLKGIFRDRIFQGIMALAVIFLFIPSAASLSMRQVTELSITLSLSLISFIMLLLAVFLGATSIWKDIERRYTFSVLSLPISRQTYLLGRFLGIALFILITALFLGSMAMISIKMASLIYPPARPLLWSAIVATIIFDALKYIVVVAIAILLATISTSFFLPVFGAISMFLAGTATQQVYDYLHTPSALVAVSAVVRKAALMLYYLLPNLSGFDLKVHAIYAIPLNIQGLLLTLIYFLVYTGIVLSIGTLLFARREMK
ncbi:MAG TPA: ABC transporter permease [Desulfuromonadaceae bacterium]|jgi:ABC-type transport system involved in multi-copper enzyme maturation permease subunit